MQQPFHPGKHRDVRDSPRSIRKPPGPMRRMYHSPNGCVAPRVPPPPSPSSTQGEKPSAQRAGGPQVGPSIEPIRASKERTHRPGLVPRKPKLSKPPWYLRCHNRLRSDRRAEEVSSAFRSAVGMESWLSSSSHHFGMEKHCTGGGFAQRSGWSPTARLCSKSIKSHASMRSKVLMRKHCCWNQAAW